MRALRMGNSPTQGSAILHIVVDEQGYTNHIEVVRSLTPALDNEAVAAVSRWRFKPALCGNTPVPIETNVEVAFRFFGRSMF